ERVVVRPVVGDDALPAALVDLPAAAGHPRVGRREVVREPDRELLRGRDAGAGERDARVLLAAGGVAGRVVAVRVHAGEVAAQLRGDGEVGDLVDVPVTPDVHEVVLGLAVLVEAQLGDLAGDLVGLGGRRCRTHRCQLPR